MRVNFVFDESGPSSATLFKLLELKVKVAIFWTNLVKEFGSLHVPTMAFHSSIGSSTLTFL